MFWRAGEYCIHWAELSVFDTVSYARFRAGLRTPGLSHPARDVCVFAAGVTPDGSQRGGWGAAAPRRDSTCQPCSSRACARLVAHMERRGWPAAASYHMVAQCARLHVRARAAGEPARVCGVRGPPGPAGDRVAVARVHRGPPARRCTAQSRGRCGAAVCVRRRTARAARAHPAPRGRGRGAARACSARET